jgi:hypothetical protein
MIGAAELLSNIPIPLREELLSRYQSLMSNYAERRWEPSELNGGKFAEAVYSVLEGALTGSYPSKAVKPNNMLAACRKLEQLPANPSLVGDRSLRVLIPRMLIALYEVRNNRGVGHIGGDVDPNHMDAEGVRAMCSWIMADLIRIFHAVSTEEAQQVVDALVERRLPLIWEIGEVRRVLEPSMKARDQTLVLLYGSNEVVSAKHLCEWVDYSNSTRFRKNILVPLHKDRLIEFNSFEDWACISPLGARKAEDLIFSLQN